jgi:hypothetical protein
MGTETFPRRELRIPKSTGDAIMQLVIMSLVLFFVLVALLNLTRGEGLIASLLWLTLVTAVSWTACREAGGLRRFLINRVAVLGWPFMESGAPETGNIRVGFQFAGRRFIQRRVSLNRIKAVEWTTGQATSMSGRDMNDWTVWLWFEDHDPVRAEGRRKWLGRNAEQDLYGIGPSARKDRAEALGLSVVNFLREAGVDLITDSKSSACFVRRDDPNPFQSRQLPT